MNRSIRKMDDRPDILKRILRRKAEEIAERAAATPLRALSARAEGAPAVRPFAYALQTAIENGKPGVIAELKRASPSKGLLRADFDSESIARSYERGGATCLSVLTDRDFFQGSEGDLQAARAACRLPTLRKDFILDPYQIYEARVVGADCILLIVAALGDAILGELFGLATDLGMDVLVEVHDQAEMERALVLEPPLIGVNNRNLRTFETHLETTLGLLSMVPDGVQLVTESGIHSREDIALMRGEGVEAFLIGEAFMRAADPGQALAALFSGREG